MTFFALLALLPWVGLGAFMAFGIREPRPLPPGTETSPGGAGGEAGPTASAEVPGARASGGPVRVSIVVPARNEARNIRRCLESLTALRGVPFEIVVVDDRSTDETARLAREVERGTARSLRVIEGKPLPEGWFGKPWACHQGAAMAGGELLLFTDADTVHEPELLARALAALREDGAAVLSLLGRQEMGSFAERLVQPQVFTLIGIRFRHLDRPVDREDWGEAIANGQFLLVTRKAYLSIGGHEAVRDEVVEDLRLAQLLTRAGHRFTMRQGEDVFCTRMYTSLRELVDGWTKNMAVGARQAAVGWGRWAIPGIATFLCIAWLAPALGAGIGVLGVLTGSLAPSHPLVIWGSVTFLFSVSIWTGAYTRFGVPAAYALLYPLGVLVVLHILARSARRGTGHIEWKGRRYVHGSSEG